MSGRSGDWREAADEIERLLGAVRNSIPISRRFEPAGRPPVLVVRADLGRNALPNRVMGFEVVVERPETPKVRRGLL